MNNYSILAFDRGGELATRDSGCFDATLRAVAELAARYPRAAIHVDSDLRDGATDATNRDGLTDDERDEIDIAIDRARGK